MADSDIRIYQPLSMADLYSILYRRPDIYLWAGGTWLALKNLQYQDLVARDICNLGGIEELQRVFRNDRLLDLGATVTLDRLLTLGSGVIPRGLGDAIRTMVPSPARALATIGGNLCIGEEISNLLPYMAIMDARLELRRQGSIRQIPAARFLNEEGKPDLENGEILTRIRLPLDRWNYQVFKHVLGDDRGGTQGLNLHGFAEVHKDSLEDLRVVIVRSNRAWWYLPELDAELVGRHLPLEQKTIEEYCVSFVRSLNGLAPDIAWTQDWRVAGLVASFLRGLGRSGSLSEPGTAGWVGAGSSNLRGAELLEG